MLAGLVGGGDAAEVENASHTGELRRDTKMAADRCRQKRRESHVRGFRLRRFGREAMVFGFAIVKNDGCFTRLPQARNTLLRS
jgi:hypothetical protein